MGHLFDYTVFPLALPFILLWCAIARLASIILPLTVVPWIIINRRLSEAAPFIPFIWRQHGWLVGGALRIGFEYSYCANVIRRILTIPLRRRPADFLVVGFPKCGTTSLAAHLKVHPCISGIDGLPWHEALSKESHFFNGALGRHNASSAALYRSYFPTCLARWWCEAVKRSGKWLCFDACPVTACMDYAPARLAAINPDAKLVLMLRDPVSGAFSAEIMLRNLGMPLEYSFTEDVRPADPRFASTPDDVAFWDRVATLAPSDPLPEELMQKYYSSCHALLRSARYVERIVPWLAHFKRENILFVDFLEFTTHTEAVMKRVFEFVGADPALAHFRALPPGMQGERKGRRMHPTVHRKLAAFFAEPNRRLYALLGRDFKWSAPDALAAPSPSAYAASVAIDVGGGASKAGKAAGAQQKQAGDARPGSAVAVVAASGASVAATLPAVSDAV